MRINRYLALCGIASRRKSEELVTNNQIKINGRPPVKGLSTEVKDSDIVTVDGVKVEPKEKHIYLMLNKPKGYVCTTADEHGRKTVMELVSAFRDSRLFPVGRLDYDTEGLLIMTTDGELANKLTHPSNDVKKTYVAKIEGEISLDELKKLQNGVILDGVKTKRCKVTLLNFEENTSRIEIVISEGRNRQVRRMFEAINREVVFLKRVGIGSLKLGGLSRGEYRVLTDRELALLEK